ncbi:hypothetical protein [Lonepinella koalarum]
MSKLLINEQPLVVQPSLACKYGLLEAVILQQIHFLLNISTNIRDGKKWVFNTYEQWSEIFPFACERTIRKAINNFEKLGILISTDKYNTMKMDKTKWYTIDYDKLPDFSSSNAEDVNDNGVFPDLSENADHVAESASPSGKSCQLTSGKICQTNNHKTTIDYNTNTSPLPPKGESANAEHESQPLAENKSLPKNKNLSVDYTGIMDEFNDCVADTPISQVRVLSDKRKRQIHSLAKLLKQEFGTCDVKTFRNYFDDFLRQVSARKDRFYFGGGKTGWVANFDYLMRAETFTKTLEDSL